jgi:hypothetical protein
MVASCSMRCIVSRTGQVPGMHALQWLLSKSSVAATWQSRFPGSERVAGARLYLHPVPKCTGQLCVMSLTLLLRVRPAVFGEQRLDASHSTTVSGCSQGQR